MRCAACRPSRLRRRAVGANSWGLCEAGRRFCSLRDIFARQAAQRIDVRHALVFASLCYIPIAVRYAIDGFEETFPAWLLTAGFCILVEACVLSALDPEGCGRKPGAHVSLLARGLGDTRRRLRLPKHGTHRRCSRYGKLWSVLADLWLGRRLAAGRRGHRRGRGTHHRMATGPAVGTRPALLLRDPVAQGVTYHRRGSLPPR